MAVNVGSRRMERAMPNKRAAKGRFASRVFQHANADLQGMGWCQYIHGPNLADDKPVCCSVEKTRDSSHLAYAELTPHHSNGTLYPQLRTRTIRRPCGAAEASRSMCHKFYSAVTNAYTPHSTTMLKDHINEQDNKQNGMFSAATHANTKHASETLGQEL